MANRAEVIQGMEKLCKKTNTPFVCFDALELLKEQSHWISVDEKLPEEVPFDCLVCRAKDGYVNRATYWNMDKTHIWLADCNFWINDVTHWMPLPKAPDN